MSALQNGEAKGDAKMNGNGNAGDATHYRASDSMSSSDSPLPTPVTQNAPKTTNNSAKVSAAVIIPIWIVVSMSVILFNKYIFSSLEFKYPVFLVTWHLTFATIGTRVLRRTTHLLDGVDEVAMTRDKFVRSVLPIGLLMSGSLVLSNSAYLHLSLSFIQMLKAFTPVAILIISISFRLQEPNRKIMAIVLLISSGVSIASYGELRFNLLGFIFQAISLLCEAFRLVFIQILLHGQKMDPLVSLYYFAPVCATFNLIILPFTEGLDPIRNFHLIGPAIFTANGALTFCLNVCAVFLVGAASSLVLTLAGVFKDIMMITGSVLLYAEPIAPLQVFGYAITLCGLYLFKVAGGK